MTCRMKQIRVVKPFIFHIYDNDYANGYEAHQGFETIVCFILMTMRMSIHEHKCRFSKPGLWGQGIFHTYDNENANVDWSEPGLWSHSMLHTCEIDMMCRWQVDEARVCFILMTMTMSMRMKQTRVVRPSPPNQERSRCRSQSSCKLFALSSDIRIQLSDYIRIVI